MAKRTSSIEMRQAHQRICPIPGCDPTAAAVELCLRDTGAIKRCTRCGERFVIAKDDQAEQHARQRAEHLWKAGLRSFDGMTWGELVAAIEAAICATPQNCPRCH